MLKLTGKEHVSIIRQYALGESTHWATCDTEALPVQVIVNDKSIVLEAWEGKRIYLDGTESLATKEKHRQAWQLNEVRFYEGKDNSGKEYKRITFQGRLINKWHRANGKDEQYFWPELRLQFWNDKEVFADLSVWNHWGRGKNSTWEASWKTLIFELDEASRKVLQSLVEQYSKQVQNK